MHNEIDDFKNNNLVQSYDDDAGYDIRCPYHVMITPRTYAVINTKLHIKLPPYLIAFVKSKSGIGINLSTECSNAGVIDPSYTGSIIVKLYNFNLNDPMIIKPGERFCQLVPLINPKIFLKMLSKGDKFEELYVIEKHISKWELDKNGRKERGLGSSGVL